MRKFAATLCLCLLLVSSLALAVDPSPRVRELQQGLIELGYDPGAADGVVGPKTREAISAYQKDHKMRPDGKYSGLLLFGLQTRLREAKKAATPEGHSKQRLEPSHVAAYVHA